jgi:hypothetical protein
MLNNSTNISIKRTITSHLDPFNIKKTTTYDVGNLDPGLGQTPKYGGVKLDNRIPTSAFDNCISNGNTYIKKTINKSAQTTIERQHQQYNSKAMNGTSLEGRIC